MKCITAWCKSKDFRQVPAPAKYSLRTYEGESMNECVACGAKWLEPSMSHADKRYTLRDMHEAVKEYRSGSGDVDGLVVRTSRAGRREP